MSVNFQKDRNRRSSVLPLGGMDKKTSIRKKLTLAECSASSFRSIRMTRKKG